MQPELSNYPVQLALLVGLPAAGKSTFCRVHLAPGHAVAGDLHAAGELLAAGCSVAVDGRHTTAAERRDWIALGRDCGARLVGYYVATTLRGSLARNRLRGAARVPEGTIVALHQQLERPTLEEGFHELWLVKALFDDQFLVSAWEHEMDACLAL
jgi:predicted kinase